jgi:hypothetical protein
LGILTRKISGIWMWVLPEQSPDLIPDDGGNSCGASLYTINLRHMTSDTESLENKGQTAPENHVAQITLLAPHDESPQNAPATESPESVGGALP